MYVCMYIDNYVYIVSFNINIVKSWIKALLSLISGIYHFDDWFSLKLKLLGVVLGIVYISAEVYFNY